MGDRQRRSAEAILTGAVALAVLGAVPVQARDARALSLDFINALADESAGKMLTSAVFKAKLNDERKARVVIGDVRNQSDDEGARVQDISNEIRNRIVLAGTARIFAPGNLDADFIISPELSSVWNASANGRRHCFILQLTLTTPEGEYVAAFSAQRCD
jgi:hypothetical protein